jgi:hypothetical protein
VLSNLDPIIQSIASIPFKDAYKLALSQQLGSVPALSTNVKSQPPERCDPLPPAGWFLFMMNRIFDLLSDEAPDVDMDSRKNPDENKDSTQAASGQMASGTDAAPEASGSTKSGEKRAKARVSIPSALGLAIIRRATLVVAAKLSTQALMKVIPIEDSSTLKDKCDFFYFALMQSQVVETVPFF